MAITIKNIVESTLQNSKHNYTIGRTTPAFTKFIVECGSVKLYGKVSANAYETQTKKLDGTVLDEVNCTIKNTDDIVNRINESINTASKLSKYVRAMTEARKDYLTPGFVNESDEDDSETKDKQLLLDDEDDTATPEKDLETSINAFYAGIVSMADEALALASSSETDEVAPDIMTDIIGYSASLYGLADDVNDTIEDLFPAPETENESIHRSIHKKTKNEKLVNEVVGKLSEISLMLKNNKDMQDIREAVKLIKSQLIVD